jgi:tRNA1(Val) A37 N6-methylase TrmN6
VYGKPKRLRLVYQRSGEEPWLILAEGRRGGNNGMRIDAPFYMEAADGSPSAQLKAVYAGERK